MWLERNKDRHGRDDLEKNEKKREQVLAELKMWYELRDEGKLQLAEAAADRIFYDTLQQHEEKKGTLARVQMWLCTFGTVLLQSKLFAAIAKRRAAGNNNN